MMDLLVQGAYVMSSSQGLQTWRHIVQMGLHSVSFESCIVSFCCIQNLIPRSDVLHSFLDVQWHFPNDTPMLIKGHARAPFESVWNLLLHLYYTSTFGPACPRALAVEFVQIASYLPKIAKLLFPCLVWQHGYRRCAKFRPCPRC